MEQKLPERLFILQEDDFVFQFGNYLPAKNNFNTALNV